MKARGEAAAQRFEKATGNSILRAATPRAWVDAAVGDLRTLLVDHANCEKKAASTALALIFTIQETVEGASVIAGRYRGSVASLKVCDSDQAPELTVTV